VVHQYEYLSTDPRSNPMINPSIIHSPHYAWLKVLDRNGQLISDRVAAVIIAPGDNLGQQSRGVGAAPNQFLDIFYKDGVAYANHDYSRADETFVMGDSAESTDTQDTSFQQPYLFNDQLVYITIDELMQAVNKRVLAESKWLLNAYAQSSGSFPNAADLSVMTIMSDTYVTGGSQTGFVPFDVTDSCQCISAERCTCRFGVVESVTMFRNNGTWKSAEDTGACTSILKASGQECTCKGAGSCSRTFSTQTTSFICDVDGVCTTQNLTVSNLNKYIYTLPSHADIYRASNNCQTIGKTVQCSGIGGFQVGLKEAAWVKQNGWQQYLYYAWSPASQLQVGMQQGVQALLIAMGAPINSEMAVNQSRPSDSIADYLDSIENANGDTQYDSRLKKASTHYNDEIWIVLP
jgi:hypothetical protein